MILVPKIKSLLFASVKGWLPELTYWSRVAGGGGVGGRGVGGALSVQGPAKVACWELPGAPREGMWDVARAPVEAEGPGVVVYVYVRNLTSGSRRLED